MKLAKEGHFLSHQRLFARLRVFALSFLVLFAGLQFLSQSRGAVETVKEAPSKELWAEKDLQKIWSSFSSRIPSVSWIQASTPSYAIECVGDSVRIIASGPDSALRREQLYAAIFEMGFLFPHPRIQITPKPEQVWSSCGRTGQFTARVAKRGFHLHMAHVTEKTNYQ
ncbi:hypothetical protein EBZ37_15390, partial [bacterium]|nr:hypothetical protein [bacterium]